MKKNLILGTLILSLLIVSACTTGSNQQELPENLVVEEQETLIEGNEVEEVVENTPEEEVLENTTVEEVVESEAAANYINAKHGFSLSFPETWNDYLSKEEDTSLGKTIYFGLSAQPDLFAISVVTKDRWNEIQNEDGPKSMYLTENEEYVFTWGVGHYAANDEMLLRVNESGSIVKTFKFIK